MIILEARAITIEQNPTSLAPTDDWERPDAVVSTAKQKAHDDFFLDGPDGEWLPAGRIAHEVHGSTHAFVGETPLGRQVFLVAPSERSRHGRERYVPLDAHLAYKFALERELLRAVQNAENQHLITHEEAIRQAGGMDPADALDALEASRAASAHARVLWKLSENQTTPQPRGAPSADQGQDSIHDGAFIAAQATQVAIPAGMAGFGIALAGTRRKDVHGRRFRSVGKIMYMTSAGIVVGSILMSACTSVQALRPQEVAGAIPMPEQFSPTVDQAKQAVALWMGMRVPLLDGEFGTFPKQAIFEVDPTDSTSKTLKTLSLLNPDGSTMNPDLRYAMGLALIPSEKTGEAVKLPFLVQLGKNGEALMMGMFFDRAQSTERIGVFRVNIVKDGQIGPVTQEVVVTKVAGGVIIELRDISDPKNIVTYHLVSTPRDTSVPPQQSVMPSQVPDNNWIGNVVAFMSVAASVQAAGPAAPEQLASATLLPTATPREAPTATLAPLPVVSDFLSGATVTSSNDFGSNTDGWSYPLDTVHRLADGTVRIDGKNASLSPNQPLKPGEAIVTYFKNESGKSHMVIDFGSFGADDFRRVAFWINNGQFGGEMFEGATFHNPTLSGNLTRINPDSWYGAMFAVSADGTVRMVIWEKDNPTKRVVYTVNHPELAGKSMKFTAETLSSGGVLIVDEAKVMNFADLTVLLEAPVQVQATPIPAQPPPVGGQEPPVVKPPDNQPNSTPQPGIFPVTLEGYGKLDYRDNMYICAPCGWKPDLASKSKNPSVTQVFIRVRDPSTLKWIEAETEEFSGNNVASAEGKINTLLDNNYKPLATVWTQSTDPQVTGVHPRTVTVALEHP